MPRPMVLAPAGFALEAIGDSHATIALEPSVVRLALYSRHAWSEPEHCEAAAQLVEAAGRVSVADLAACGSVDLLLDLLADVQREGRAWARAA